MSESDNRIISIAMDTNVHDAAWEQLENRCESDEARSRIKQIFMRKWRRLEYATDML